MKKTILIILTLFCLNINIAQVGIGTSMPHSSSILDVESTNKGFLLPRLDTDDRDAINSGVFAPGLMIYNLDAKCIEVWNSSEWINLCGTTAAAEVNCPNSGFNGIMTDGVVISSASFDVVLENNGSSDVDLVLSSADITLGGLSSGLAVGTPDFTTFTLTAGTSQTVSYPITGTPSGSGTLSVDWANGSLICNKTRNIAQGVATFTKAKNNPYIFSVNDVTLVPTIDVQGTLGTGTTINIPYTGGIGAYTAYTSPDIAINSSFVEDGSSDWTFSYNYPSGVFSASGNLVANIVVKKAGVETAFDALRVSSILTINFDFVSLPLVVNDNVLSNTVGLDEGGDVIRGAMSIAGCATCTAYDAAPNQSWIRITQAEYDQMPITVTNTVRGGVQEASYASANSSAHAGFAHIQLVDNGSTTESVPDGHYIYAFKINFNGSATINTLRFFDGPRNSRNMTQLGPDIPGFTGGGLQYFVYKRNNTTTVGQRSLGLYSPQLDLLGISGPGQEIYYNFTGPTGMNNTYPTLGISLQGLATDTKQW